MSVTIRTNATITAKRTKPRSFWARLRNMMTLRRERQQLRALDDHILADIGVTRAQALQESRKTPWDAPHHWHS